MPFSPEGNYQRSERQEYIHQLIAEFRDHLTKDGYEVPVKTDGVVALSAPFEKRGEEIIEKSDENVARIEYSIQAIKDTTAKRLGKKVEEVTESDLISQGPPLILNGETEQLPMMHEVALEQDFPEEKIQLVDCGPRGVGNTKTQFTTMDQDPTNVDKKHWTFVSSSYHVPRVARTAMVNLDEKREFDVIGVPLDRIPCDVYRKIRGVVKRILTYSEKGDISK